MVYVFAKQSGGKVRIHSDFAKGTEVCIYLPRFSIDSGSTETIANASPGLATGEGETVLVVDDEPLVRMLMTDVLEENGYVVIEAEDGNAGLKVLLSDARIDLLVTDVGLPGGMNGKQMADVGRPIGMTSGCCSSRTTPRARFSAAALKRARLFLRNRSPSKAWRARSA